jgi:hypothetical protein
MSIKGNSHLQKLELKHFNWDIRNRIGFEGQLHKIHEDSDIDTENKFQYLIQATVPGSSATEFIQSFPSFRGNYVNTTEHLKSDVLLMNYWSKFMFIGYWT